MPPQGDKVRLELWTPFEIRVFFRNGEDRALSKEHHEMLVRLATALPMKRFWEWLDAANDGQGDGPELDPMFLFWRAVRGTKLPEPPGGVSPRARKRHLEKVKHHASALIALLRDTRFDLDLDDISEGLGWDRKEVEAALSDYPSCTLTEQLTQLLDWCEQEDYHDRHRTPTWMLRQGGAPAKKHFLAEALYSAFEHARISPPWEHLATLINVALDLPESEALNPDTTQKMVARIIDRRPGPETDDVGLHGSSMAEAAIEFYLANRDHMQPNKK